MSNDLFSNLFDMEDATVDEMYTTKVSIPQYLPNMTCPSLSELFDDRKYRQLIETINKANVTEDEKDFLKKAATRHIVFTYSKIADYYAHASKEMQQLMEQSALVIIDIDDAIANGYVKLSKQISQLMSETGRVAGENHNQYSK